MKDLTCLDRYRIDIWGDGELGDEHNGAFEMLLNGSNLKFSIIASDGADWEHVSVSTEYRIPKWNEMQQIKELFFEDDETVMQLHPPKTDYINNHPYCLHLWRPMKVAIPRPPTILVGIK